MVVAMDLFSYLLVYSANNSGYDLKKPYFMAAVQVVLTELTISAWRKPMRLEMVLVSKTFLRMNVFGWGVILCYSLRLHCHNPVGLSHHPVKIVFLLICMSAAYFPNMTMQHESHSVAMAKRLFMRSGKW